MEVSVFPLQSISITAHPQLNVIFSKVLRIHAFSFSHKPFASLDLKDAVLPCVLIPLFFVLMKKLSATYMLPGTSFLYFTLFYA